MDGFNVFVSATKLVTLYSCIVSIPLYIMVLYVILRKRKTPPYDSSYFTLFVALGVVDIIGWSLYLIRKSVFWELEIILNLFKPFNELTVLSTTVTYLIWAFGLMQFQITVLMQINRYICICWPTLFNKLGTNKMTFIFICIIFLISVTTCIPIIISGSTVIETTLYISNQTYALTHGGPDFFNGYYAAVYNSVFNITVYTNVGTGLVVYPLILRKIYTANRIPNQQISRKKHELPIIYSALLLFLMNFIYFVCIVLCPILMSNYMWTLLIAGDIYDTYNAYSLMLTSKEVRKSVIKFITMNRIYKVNASNQNVFVK